jgi:hypothetical protein
VDEFEVMSVERLTLQKSKKKTESLTDYKNMKNTSTSLLLLVVVFSFLFFSFQVERQFHDRELKRQPLRLVWVPLHYHLVV